MQCKEVQPEQDAASLMADSALLTEHEKLLNSSSKVYGRQDQERKKSYEGETPWNSQIPGRKDSRYIFYSIIAQSHA